MNERVVPKMANFCVAYMDVAGGVPMRGVSRSGSFVKLSNSPAKAGPMSAASAQRGPRSAFAIGSYLRSTP